MLPQVYISGHGGNEFMKFQDTEELMAQVCWHVCMQARTQVEGWKQEECAFGNEGWDGGSQVECSIRVCILTFSWLQDGCAGTQDLCVYGGGLSTCPLVMWCGVRKPLQNWKCLEDALATDSFS